MCHLRINLVKIVIFHIQAKFEYRARMPPQSYFYDRINTIQNKNREKIKTCEIISDVIDDFVPTVSHQTIEHENTWSAGDWRNRAVLLVLRKLRTIG